MLKPTKGRILLIFRKGEIEGQFKHKLTEEAYLEIVNPNNPNDYSLEVAEVYAVNSAQQFFKPGDSVILHYMIFTAGKHPGRYQTNTHLMERLENGDEIYWCHDGTDGHNEPDVFAKVSVDESGKMVLDPAPGYVFINKPEKKEMTAGGLHIPGAAQTQDRDKNFWATILFINSEDASTLALQSGQRIYCVGSVARPVFINKQEVGMIRPRHFVMQEPIENDKE